MLEKLYDTLEKTNKTMCTLKKGFSFELEDAVVFKKLFLVKSENRTIICIGSDEFLIDELISIHNFLLSCRILDDRGE